MKWTYASILIIVATATTADADAVADAVAPAAPGVETTTELPPPPPPVTRPGGSLTLPRGKVRTSLTMEIESSDGKLGEPVSFAPDVSYGATDDLTLSVVHSKFAITGFRAAAGGGICLGDDAACPHVYDNVGAEGLYTVASGPLAVAIIGGVHALRIDDGFYSAKVGAQVRYAAGKLGVQTTPIVLVALTEREDAAGMRRNHDLLFVPVLATYRAMPALTVGLGSGFKGALDELGATWEWPLGAVVTYAIDRRITIGASLIFGKLLGGADDPPDPAPPATGPDYRGTQLWLTTVL